MADSPQNSPGFVADPRDGPLPCAHDRPPRPWQPIETLPELTPEQARLAAVLAEARLFLWTAQVRRHGSDYAWELSVAPESLHSPLLAYTAFRQHGFLWHPAFAPDYATTERTYCEALDRGADRYEQQFRIVYGGRTRWLHEVVRIAAVGPESWEFSGLVRDITEQKLAEDAERRTRVELERLLQHAQCMLWQGRVVDRDGHLAWEMTLLPSGLQRKIFDHASGPMTQGLYEPFDIPQADAMHALSSDALRTGAPGYQQEFMITRRRDGQTFWLREHVSIQPEQPGVWSLSGVMIDVTAQKLAEQARATTEVQLRQLVEHVDCIVWQARLTPEPNGEYTWNISAPPSRLFRRLFGRDPEGAGPLWSPASTPEFEAMDRNWRNAVAQGLPGYEQQFRHVVDGQVIWLHENVTLRGRQADGSIQLAGVIVDVTQRKLAELQLNAEKERLAVTLRAMEESVVTLDAAGIVTYLNEAAEALLEVTAAAVLGQRLDAVAPLRAGEPAQPVAWPTAAATAVPLPAHAELTRTSRRAVRIEGCVAPLRDPTGHVAGTVIVLRDVTERHVMEAHLQRASTLESVGILAGGIAHDFNNILTALLANLSLAELDAAPGTPIHARLREAHAATDRAAALAKQLLTFAKGGDPLLAAVDLPDVINEVTRFTLRGTQVDHAVDFAAGLWPVQADRGQLAQIVQNLVLNAAQSMPNGGTVRIAARNETVTAGATQALTPGRYVLLTISDGGHGITPESLDKIFTPYFTTKPGGHGLGLAVVYSIVKKHRGAIDVRSQPDEGTTFELRLPAAIPTSPAPAGAVRPGVSRLSGRVLLMDDEPAIVTVLTSYFRHLGLEVQATADGAQAVAAFRAAQQAAKPFDAVVMDLTVPGKMGGREAIAELLKLDPDVRAIVASGYSSDPVLAHYQAYGFSAVAAKPFDIRKLAGQVATLIEARRQAPSGSRAG